VIGPVLAFGAATMRQFVNDRSSLFFSVALPIAIIVIIGSTFGGNQPLEIVVAGTGPVADAVAAELVAGDGVEVVRAADIDEARSIIRRFDAEAAVVVSPDGFTFVANEAQADVGFAARGVIQRAVDSATAPAGAPRVQVVTTTVGEATFDSASNFSLTSAQNLVLFTFITALTSGALVVRARRAGVLRRAAASPAGVGAMAVGLSATWFVLALVQSLLIVLVGALGFGVEWGDPGAGAGLLLTFALVGSGAGLLVGSFMTDEDQVSSIGPPLALSLAALGGCMAPTEIFPEWVLGFSRATPHYWALEGWKDVIFDNATLADIAPRLGVLTAFAVVMLGVANLQLRRVLAR
jgi:ABC-2 type transport system permease protein